MRLKRGKKTVAVEMGEGGWRARRGWRGGKQQTTSQQEGEDEREEKKTRTDF